MATTKITELTAYTNPATTDVLPIVDVAADSTKKIEVPELFKGVGDGTEAAPAIAFASESSTGFYRPGSPYTNTLGISTGGTNRGTFLTQGTQSYLRFSQDFDGIQFKGNTSIASTLDDYESGTFTPIIEGDSTAGTGTYTTQTGNYKKVGGIVSFNLHLVWTAHTGSGNMRIDDLPFISTFGFHPVPIMSDNITLITNYILTAYVIPGSSLIELHQTALSTTSDSTVSLDSSGEIIVAGTYNTSF